MKKLNVCLRKWASVLLTAVFALAWAFPAMAASGSAPLGQWSVRYQATDHTPEIYEITYGNNIFVALNGGQSVITSPDGVNWTEQQNPEMKGGSVGGITFGNGIFVAVGAKILTSPDGANWTERTANVGQGLSAGDLWEWNFCGSRKTRHDHDLPGWRHVDIPGVGLNDNSSDCLW